MKGTLEKALVDEFTKVGIPEPKRVYRPAIEARDILDETDEALNRITKRLQKSLPWLNPGQQIDKTLFKWEVVENGLRAQYSLREKQYNPNFSIEGVNASIMTGNYDEEFGIAEAETESRSRGNDIIICSARDNGKFSIIMAENLGSKYDITGISKLKRKKNPQIEDFAREVAKLLKSKV